MLPTFKPILGCVSSRWGFEWEWARRVKGLRLGMAFEVSHSKCFCAS